MEIRRKRFQGVLNILNFNRHFYIVGLLVLMIIIMSWLIFSWSNSLFYIIVTAFIYGLIMPLIVSAYIYDYSGYYNFDWLEDFNLNNTNPAKIININAGFDETSFILKNHFPKSRIQVFDFYNSKQHIEPAIVRARKVSLIYPNTKSIKTNAIPLKNESTDLIFLLSAAHEIRLYEEKVEFLKECRRICKPNGKVIMVEHINEGISTTVYPG